MKLTTTLLNRNYFSKFLLTLALVVFGGGNLWGDTFFFNGTIDTNNWAFTNTSGSSSYSVDANNELSSSYAGMGTRCYSSKNKITIASGDVIIINAKRYSTGSGSNITVKYRSNDSDDWTAATPFFGDSELSTSSYQNLSEVSITSGEYYIQFEISFARVHSITLKAASIPTPTSFSATPSFSSATLSWTAGGDETKWQIKYNAGSDFNPNESGTMASDNPVTTNPYTLSGLEEETTYYAYIRAYVDEENQSDWVALDEPFTTTAQYPKPTSFALVSTTGGAATFSWTAGDDEKAWQIAYSTEEDFTPATEGVKVYFTEDDLSDGKYTIGGLVDGITYYAYIRSYYGGKADNPLNGEKFSKWSDKIEFTLIDIRDFNTGGNTTSNYIPIYGGSVATEGTHSQFVIPKSELTSIINHNITKLTFYTSNSTTYENVSWGDATFEVYLNEVENEKYTSPYTYNDWGRKVLNATKLSVENHKMEVEFDNPTPYKYQGGHLMIGFKLISTGTNSAISWIALSRTWGNNYGVYGTTPTNQYVVPQVTITSVSPTVPVTLDNNGFTTFACARPLDLTTANMPDGLTAYRATVDAANSKVRFTSDINQTVAANTGVLLQGSANTTYNIPFAESGTAVADNDFMVNSTGGTFAADDRYTYFGMKKNTYPLLFGTFDPSSVAIPTNRAYLKVDEVTAAHGLTCVFDDGEATGVQELKNARIEELKSYYDLQGRKVLDGNANGQLAKGLYIVNGRKVVIK